MGEATRPPPGTGDEMSGSWISFLSDYGFDDACVGVCHGVVARHAPEVRIIDVCHAVVPQDVEHGAITLAGAVATCRSASGWPLSSRSNSVVSLAVSPFVRLTARSSSRRTTGLRRWRGMRPAAWWRRTRSPTSPSGCRCRPPYFEVVTSMPRSRHGWPPVLTSPRWVRECHPETLCRLQPRQCRLDGDHLHAEVVYVDHFGNAALNVVRADLEAVGIMLGDDVEVRTTARSVTLPYSPTYGDVPAGSTVLCEDSLRRVTISVNCGRAVDVLRLRRRDAVVVSQVVRRPTSRVATDARGDRTSVSA